MKPDVRMIFGERVPWVWVLIAWTLFLWLSRLRNVLLNEELSSGGRAVRVAVVVIFVVLAAAAAGAVRRKLNPNILAIFLTWTVGYWLIRGIGILIDGDYSAGFKAVHTALMLVSLTLSLLTARQVRSAG